jgi:hypothetical protein
MSIPYQYHNGDRIQINTNKLAYHRYVSDRVEVTMPAQTHAVVIHTDRRLVYVRKLHGDDRSTESVVELPDWDGTELVPEHESEQVQALREAAARLATDISPELMSQAMIHKDLGMQNPVNRGLRAQKISAILYGIADKIDNGFHQGELSSMESETWQQ